MTRSLPARLYRVDNVRSHRGHIDVRAYREIAMGAFEDKAVPLRSAERHGAGHCFEREVIELLLTMRTGRHLGLRGDFRGIVA
jgi:hypothetical protein